MDGKRERPGLRREIPDTGNNEKQRHRSKNAKMLVGIQRNDYRTWKGRPCWGQLLKRILESSSLLIL